jgi:hypothetical protein
MKRRLFIRGGLACTGSVLASCGGGGGGSNPGSDAAQAASAVQPEDPTLLMAKKARLPAPAPATPAAPVAAPPQPLPGGRPFRDESIWNIPIPATAARSSWIASWSPAAWYARGDSVRTTSGSENYIHISLTGGVNKPPPAGQASSADWSYCGVSASQWYDAGAGTPVFAATDADPVWSLRFNSNCYGHLASGTWSRRVTDAGASDRIWNDAATRSTLAADYNDYVTVSTAGLVPPSPGTYDPKGSGQRDPLLVPTRQLPAPTGLLPSEGGTDWTLIVHLPDGTVLETFATVVLTGNRLVCGSYKITRPGLSGDGWQNGFRASMVPGYAGLITQAQWAAAWQEDIESSGLRGTIAHALAILAPARLLRQAAVYPAAAWDSQVNLPYSGTRFAMGQRLALPADFPLDTLDFTRADGRFARIIGRTMKTHGGIVVDRGGSGLSILHEQTGDTTSASMVLRHLGGAEPAGTYRNDQMLRMVLAHTQMVTIAPAHYLPSV